MKNIFIYYLLIIAPLGIIVWLMNVQLITGMLSFYLLLFYTFVYRTFIDGKRLELKHVISKQDI